MRLSATVYEGCYSIKNGIFNGIFSGNYGYPIVIVCQLMQYFLFYSLSETRFDNDDAIVLGSALEINTSVTHIM